MHIEVITNIDEQTREIYRFYLFDFSIVFDKYWLETKIKPKRTWTTVKFWDRISTRSSNITEPILTDEIRELALIKAKKQIKVQTWSEYKGK
jgi:hypothetical protein